MTTYDNINERPRRREKSPEQKVQEEARRKAWKEKRATEMIHRNPKWSPVYKLEEKTAGQLLDRQAVLKAEYRGLQQCIKNLKHLDDITIEDMCYQDSAFMGTPLEDECAEMLNRLRSAYERALDKIPEWLDAVEEELSKRTGEQNWNRAETRDLDF